MLKPISALWWATTFAWAVLIFYLSTRTFGPDFTEGLLAGAFSILHIRVSWGTFSLVHLLLRKLAHITEYAIFALLLYGPSGEKDREFWRPRRAVFCILGIFPDG